MDTRKRVMVRSTFNQPIVRRLQNEGSESVIISREEVTNGISIPKKDVFEYDPEIYERMTKYDRLLDSHPIELEQLWQKAKPVFAGSK